AVAGVLLLLILVAGAGYYMYQRAQTDSELTEILVMLDRDEPGWRLGDLDRKRFAAVPGDKNSVAVIRKLQMQLPGWNREDPEEDWHNLPPGEPLPAKQLAFLRARAALVEKN